MDKRPSKLWGGDRTGKIKLFMIILSVLLASGGAAVFLLQGPAVETTAEDSKVPENEAEAEPPKLVELGEFLVNLINEDELRYLKIEVALSLWGEGLEGGGQGHGGEAPPELPREELMKAKDVTVETSSAQKFWALRTPTGKQQFKESLKEALEQALPDYQIEEVLFVSFVMQ